MRSYLNENAPEIIALKAELKAHKEQLEKERRKVASNASKDRLNDIVAQFEALYLNLSFAEDVYKTAITAVETTRIEIGRKAKQLVVIQSPYKPQSAAYPDKIYNIITIFVILSLVFGIVRLVRAIIDEHRY
jgi:capsular polysaccharide transport system permease protein